MKIHSSICLFVALFTSIAQGILLSDAFTSKETINYLYGQITQFELSNNTLVGISSFGQLVGIDVKQSHSINWRIHIGDLGTSKLLVNQDKVYIYNQGNDVYQVDSTNGKMNIITLKATPVKMVGASGGVFVVDSNGKLSFIDDKSGIFVQINTGGDELVESIRVDSDGGRFSYIIVNDSRLLKISNQGGGEVKVLFGIEVSVGSIKHFKSGIIITENDQIFKFVEKKISIKSFKRVENNSFKDLQVINENFLYSTSQDLIKIITISKNKAELIDSLTIKSNSQVELLRSPFNDLIVATSSLGIKYVFDLTDFLITGNSKSIKQLTIKSTVSHTSDFLTVEENKLALLSIDSHLNGELFSLFDGQLIKPIKAGIQSYSQINDYIIIDPPESQQVIHQVSEILQVDNKFILTNWITRVKRHLSEFGQFVLSFRKAGESNASDVEFGFVKYIVFFDELNQKLVAMKSNDGEIAWESVVIHDEFISLSALSEDKLIVIFHGFILVFDSSDGSIIERLVNENYTEIIKVRGETCALRKENGVKLLQSNSQDTYLVNKGDNYLSGQIIPQGETLGKQTWKFQFDEPILAMANIDFDSTTSSIGIPLADKSVLYKYLNPNLISLLTFNEKLKLHLIDGITGNLLYVNVHDEEEVVDLNSIKLIMDDNWVIYSYFTKSPRFEQRINVLDLFDKDKQQTSNSAFTRDLTIDSISSKSYIYPERILDLSSSRTNYGITIKSIIAIIESGQIIEIPKFVLNSRRIDDRQLVKQDYENDFNVIPYNAILPQPGPINHKYQLITSDGGKILIKPTRFESTMVICYFNKFNQFCSTIQPSKSFDILNESFNKGKLIITLILLLVVFVVTKPFVFNKKLNNQWLDR
ncbi:ER membrane protein complex subunit 1 [Spathaspora sp. JA1]|nr:ER membrane protein complex subunit 1 [Spathaspora sp. JA1]